MDDDPGAAYDSIAEDYERTRTADAGLSGMRNREIERPTMFDLVPAELSGKALLDVGCGPGIHAEEYARRGANVHGVDPSGEMIARARRRVPKGSFEIGRVEKLPLDEKRFDIVTCSYVLTHVRDLPGAAAEMTRVLTPGGLLVCSFEHPLCHMFRNGASPTNDYFDAKPRKYDIAGSGSAIIGYPRPLDRWFRAFLEQGLVLRGFRESRPDPSWPERFPGFDESLMRIPLLAFFVWQKPRER